MRILFYIGILSTFCVSSYGQESSPDLFYRIKKGEWAAQVLRDLGLQPLFGPNQAVQKTVRMNNYCAPSECNILHPDDRLVFPAEFSEHIRSHAKVLPTGEVLMGMPDDITNLENNEHPEPEPPQLEPIEALFTANRSHRVRISLRYIEFEGEDIVSNSKASSTSLYSPALEYRFENHFVNKWGYFIGAEGLLLNMSRAPTELMQDREHLLGNLFFGLNYFINMKLQVFAQYNLIEQILFQGISGSQVNLDQSFENDFGMGLKYELFESLKSKLAITAIYQYAVKSEHRNKESTSGSGYFVDVDLQNFIFNKWISTFINYQHHKIEFDSSKFTNDEYVFGLGYSY